MHGARTGHQRQDKSSVATRKSPQAAKRAAKKGGFHGQQEQDVLTLSLLKKSEEGTRGIL